MRLGLTNGCFDGLHEGHKFFLRECLLHCDKLVVLVNNDEWIRANKREPDHSLWSRVLGVRSQLRAWDHAQPWDGGNLSFHLIDRMPDVVFRGWDQADDVGLMPVMRFPRFGEYSTRRRA